MKIEMDDIEKRFWSKVNIIRDENSCWEWTSNKHRQGYGFFKLFGLNLLAHRVSFLLTTEFDLSPESKLLHTCDNTGCVRPTHLIEGSQKDNICDMAAKGRHRGSSKLTDDQVRAIRTDPRPQTHIELEMGLSSGTVSRIKSGARYGRVHNQGQTGIELPKV